MKNVNTLVYFMLTKKFEASADKKYVAFNKFHTSSFVCVDKMINVLNLP